MQNERRRDGCNSNIRGDSRDDSLSLFKEIMAEQPEILEDISCEDGGTTVRGTGDRGIGRVESPVEKSGKHLSNEQRNAITTLAKRSFTAAQISSGTWLQDVILCGTDERAKEVASRIRRRLDSYGRSVFIVSTHDNHIHVLHDCAYAGLSCRCKWRKETQEKEDVDFRGRLRKRRRRRVSELSLSDWERIYLYFSTEGRRQETPPYINGKVSTLPIEIRDLAIERLERPRRKDNPLATEKREDLEGDPDDLRLDFKNAQVSFRDGGSDDAPLPRRKKQRQEDTSIMAQLQRLLEQFPVSPLTNICDHPKYLESDLRFIRARKCCYQDGIDLFGKTIMRWSIEDFYNKLYSKEDCEPSFSAGHMPINDYYYDIESSLDIISKLLLYQFNHDEELVYNFLKDVYDVCNRNIPKLNTLLIFSPPSAGKNFFVDFVVDYFLNKGQLGTANKQNNFAFQDAYGKRIIFWDEPNYEAAAVEQLKKMCAGDSYTVFVKNKPDMAVYKTPVFILTNNQISIMNSPAFKDRITQYRWTAAPFLKDCDKKPYPLAFYHLLCKYKIIKYNEFYYAPLFLTLELAVEEESEEVGAVAVKLYLPRRMG